MLHWLEGELHSCLAREHEVEWDIRIDASQSLALINLGLTEGKKEKNTDKKDVVGATSCCVRQTLSNRIPFTKKEPTQLDRAGSHSLSFKGIDKRLRRLSYQELNSVVLKKSPFSSLFRLRHIAWFFVA
ncbi:hypothetical protein TNCV_884681 [Trichonephila clavipes]|nr:hypothetical protein TNCV_884681 [Trichonephila clavipes]